MTIKYYAMLSKLAYMDSDFINGLIDSDNSTINFYRFIINKTGFKFIESVHFDSGLDLMVFQKKLTYFLVFRGTQITCIKDIVTDLTLAFSTDGGVKQFQDALEYTNNRFNNNEEVVIIGHSLGGGIAQYVSAYTSVKRKETHTFNGVGVGHMVDDDRTIENVFNHINKMDVLNLLAPRLVNFITGIAVNNLEHIGEIMIYKPCNTFLLFKSHGDFDAFIYRNGKKIGKFQRWLRFGGLLNKLKNRFVEFIKRDT